MWLENDMSLTYEGLCGLTLTDDPNWNIIYPCISLVAAFAFGIIGAFTFYYFHKHMPNTEGFQRKKFNDSRIIGLYVVGFSTYLALLGVFNLIDDINCFEQTPLVSLTIFATISNALKIFEFFFLIFLIIKSDHFRYRLKKMLRGLFQSGDRQKTRSELNSHDVEFL